MITDRPGAVNPPARSPRPGRQLADPLAAWALRLRNRTDVHVRYLHADRGCGPDRERAAAAARTVHAAADARDHPAAFHRAVPGRPGRPARHVARRRRADWSSSTSTPTARATTPRPTGRWPWPSTSRPGPRFDVLLLDSNGKGGFHVWIVFESPIPASRRGGWAGGWSATTRSFGLAKPGPRISRRAPPSPARDRDWRAAAGPAPHRALDPGVGRRSNLYWLGEAAIESDPVDPRQ